MAEKVQFRTGDMVNLPFHDDCSDYVTAGFSIHNIPSPEGRRKAISEACRVLKTRGTFVVSDIRYTGEYVRQLNALGITTVETYHVGISG